MSSTISSTNMTFSSSDKSVKNTAATGYKPTTRHNVFDFYSR